MLQRYVLNPFAELVLGVRETWSPEMKEIRERSMIAKVREVGEGRFITTRAAQGTLVFLAFDTLIGLGKVLGGKRSWAAFVHGASPWQYLVVGAFGFIIIAISAGYAVENLRKKYPEEFSEEV